MNDIFRTKITRQNLLDFPKKRQCSGLYSTQNVVYCIAIGSAMMLRGLECVVLQYYPMFQCSFTYLLGLLREQRHIYKTTKTMMDGLCQRSAEKYWVKAAMAKKTFRETSINCVSKTDFFFSENLNPGISDLWILTLDNIDFKVQFQSPFNITKQP